MKLNPFIRFFVEVGLMTLSVAIVLFFLGLIMGWDSLVQYSNGFFLSFVILAAISSFGVFLKKPGSYIVDKSSDPHETKSVDDRSGLEQFLATRSLNFKMLMAALLCLLLSILIAQ